MNVLLLNTNAFSDPYPVYPLGLAWLARSLDLAGHAVALYDPRRDLFPPEDHPRLAEADLLGLSIRNVDNVDAHAPASLIGDLPELVARLRERSAARIVLGGSGFALFPEEILARTGADFGIVGEAETALPALASALQGGDSLDDIPGLCWRENGRFRLQPTRTDPFFTSQLPLHEAELVRAYGDDGTPIGVQTRRGCPLHCCYCTYPVIEGRCSRYRDPEAVAAEFVELAGLGARYVFVVDSVFNLDPRHAESVAEALVAHGNRLPWGAFLSPRHFDETLAGKLKASGLTHAEFGADSFNDEVLRAGGKNFTFAHVQEAHAAATAVGIHCSYFILAGGPGETEATLEDTLAKADRLPGAVFFASAGMRVYPQTPLARIATLEAGMTTGTHGLEPSFYFSEQSPQSMLEERLRVHCERRRNWVYDKSSPAMETMSARLRRRRTPGPLWEYIELTHRLASAP